MPAVPRRYTSFVQWPFVQRPLPSDESAAGRWQFTKNARHRVGGRLGVANFGVGSSPASLPVLERQTRQTRRAPRLGVASTGVSSSPVSLPAHGRPAHGRQTRRQGLEFTRHATSHTGFEGWVCSFLLAASAMFAACDTTAGTLQVRIVTSPGSDLLVRASQLRVTLSDPPTVRIVVKQAGGFALDLDVAAAAQRAVVKIEALDAAGELLAWGETPPLVLGPISAELAVFIAPPQTFALAPAQFEPARADMGATALSFGALFAGGLDVAGVVRAEVEIYNAYTHSFQLGAPLPAARVAPAVVANGIQLAFIVGGEDSARNAAAGGWMFDTSVAPAGGYSNIVSNIAAPAGQVALPIASSGTNRFVLSGPVAQLLDGPSLTAVALTPLVAVPARGATVVVNNAVAAFFVGDRVSSAIVKIDSAGVTFEQADIIGARRIGHAVIGRGSDLLIVGGGTTAALAGSILKIDTTTMSAMSFEGVLQPPRRDAAVALAGAGRWLIVAGGFDATDGGPATVLQTADVFDAVTLLRVAQLPLAYARAGATAFSLPNGQVLLGGGRDAAGQPIAHVELFTPSALP